MPTSAEVKKAIQEAELKIMEYRLQLLQQGKLPDKDAEFNEIKKAWKEAEFKHTTGASGTPCRHCGGSGREP
jgi:hypothetical protein